MTLSRALLAACLASCGSPEGGHAPGADTSEGADPVVALPLAGCIYYRTAIAEVGGTAMSLLVDTGSSTLAVSAAGCSSCEEAGVEAFYDSEHGLDQGVGVTNSYDSGNMGWTGNVYRDSVAFPGLPLVEMDFVAVSTQESMFGRHRCDYDEHVPVDGILGLGPDVGVRPGAEAFLAALGDSQAVEDVVALRLCHRGGTLWLGGHDDDAVIGPMNETSLLDGTPYLVEVSALGLARADGRTIDVPVATNGASTVGVLDSGGPNLILPEIAYEVIASELTSLPEIAAFGEAWWAREYVSSSLSPTELDAALPAFAVELGGGEVSLALPATESYVAWWDNGDGTYTYWNSLLNGADYGWGGDIDLGNLPMFSYVVRMDRATGRVGFAPAAPCP